MSELARSRIAVLASESALAVDLAELASLAVRVDSGLLRRLRLELLPVAEPGVESDLWFSPLVESRSGSGFQMAPDVVRELRERLARDKARVAQVRQVTAAAHIRCAPAILLEEDLNGLALERGDAAQPEIEARARPLLRTLQGGGSNALDVARWIVQAAARLDPRVQRAPAVQVLLLASAWLVGSPVASELPHDATPLGELAWVLSSLDPLGRRRIAAEFFPGGVRFEEAPPTGDAIEMPDTDPTLVELEWAIDGVTRRRTAEAIPGAIVELAGDPDSVRLTTLAGRRYRLGRVAAIRTGGAYEGFQVEGANAKALFTLKLHRGEGMTLIAMNWKTGEPPQDFVGFAIEYQEPGGSQFFALNNRLGFLDAAGNGNPAALSTLQSPIQKFRWVHFPFNAGLAGDFNYRVTPMFMDAQDQLSAGEPQEVAIQLARETYPGIANVTFTRGFVSSQAFVDRYVKDGPINTLVAPVAAKGLDFTSTHPDSVAALAWMGFRARAAILETLDQAIADQAEVRVIAYDFNLPEIVDRLEKLGGSLKIIIDDSKGHGGEGTAETEAEGRLVASTGRANVLRQHMGSLQHNKTIAVNGATVKKVVCGSTNLSWRGFFVHSNNAFVLTGQTAVDLFFAAFDSYFTDAKNSVAGFAAKPSADWNDLGLPGIDAKVTFSPHSAANAKLGGVAADIKTNTTSSLLYSLAFLYETPGVVLDAIKAVTADKNIFVYGISDKKGGLDVQDPSGNVAPVYAAELGANVPEPFRSEPSGGPGRHMHHKFIVIDFDKPTARVYLGSYNFSLPADLKNGENLVIVRDRRIAVSYMIEALSLFDHYSFRVAKKNAAATGEKLHLSRPPRAPGEKPWWDDDYKVAHKIKERLLFA